MSDVVVVVVLVVVVVVVVCRSKPIGIERKHTPHTMHQTRNARPLVHQCTRTQGRVFINAEDRFLDCA